MDLKKTILSGIQPSGQLCLGNYIGAIINWKKLQKDYRCIFLVVDLHALTVYQVPSEFRSRTLSFIAQYIACGINPKESIIALQSQISAHSELTWILNTITYLGELNRMTQFKDKKNNKTEGVNSGLLTYPILMASDILLYQADLVPVGADQRQHIELARNLAERFNNKYSETFVIPEVLINKHGARIMSLQNPDNKMSKSDKNLSNIIALLDSKDDIVKKINRAVTDSYNKINYSIKDQPGLSNLIQIFSSLSDTTIEETVNDYINQNYSKFKKDLSELIINQLEPIQYEYKKLISDREYLMEMVTSGKEKSDKIANKTLYKVKRKLGLILK